MTATAEPRIRPRITAEQYARLPKAVRAYIERLEIDNDYAQATVLAALGGDRQTGRVHVDITGLDGAVALPTDTRVRFYTDPMTDTARRVLDYVEAHLIEDGGDMVVWIHCSGGGLAVEPDAANAVTLRVRP